MRHLSACDRLSYTSLGVTKVALPEKNCGAAENGKHVAANNIGILTYCRVMHPDKQIRVDPVIRIDVDELPACGGIHPSLARG